MSSDFPPSAADVINDVVGSPNLFKGVVAYTHYGYNVREWTAIFFTVAFGASFVMHILQAGFSRRWFLFYSFVLAAGLEAGGWGARLASAESIAWIFNYGGLWDSDNNAFMAQIVALILGPAFQMMGAYILLGVLITSFGQQYCRLAPKTYVAIFLTGDLLSLIIQGVGGGIAASASTVEDANTGGYIMAGGVIFQMVIMISYSWLLIEFAWRFLKQRPTTQVHPFVWLARRRNAHHRAVSSSSSQRTTVEPEQADDYLTRTQGKLLLVGLAFSTLLVFVRSVYRCPELLSGWSGPIIENQTLFDILDGSMILASLLTLNVFHPVWCAPKGQARPNGAASDIPLDKRGQSLV